MSFRVELDIFRGPLDLLLYLVRKHELDILDLPIAPIVDQFLQYLDVLEQLDVNLAGDFLEVASTLIEMKSRMALPRGGEIEEEPLEDPRQELVQRLLEYKKFKDAAGILEERGRQWQQRFPRLSDDLADALRQPAEASFREVELWDLVSAFGRILRENALAQPANIVYDDTPIQVHMERIHGQLTERGRLALSQLFQPGQHKSSLVGIFLAVLELVRHHGAVTEQNHLFGEIWVLPGETSPESLDLSSAETYEHPAPPVETPPDEVAPLDKKERKKRAQ